ncbi:MAG TPA: hypothetical protein VGM91_00920 [Conexibacter sp.]|jgi:hypothetical protein
MSDYVAEAVEQRLEQGEATRLRALGTAVIVGFGAAMLAYRLLRNNNAGKHDEGG